MDGKWKERIIQFLTDYFAHIAVAGTFAGLGWAAEFFQGTFSWIVNLAMQAR